MTTHATVPRTAATGRPRPRRAWGATLLMAALVATTWCPHALAQPNSAGASGDARDNHPASLWNDALSHARAGEIGEAVWHLERGVWLSPLDREMRGVRDAAQAEARRLRADAMATGRMTQGEPPSLFWWRFLTGISLDVAGWTLLLSVWIASIVVLVRRRVPVGGLRDGLLVAALCGGLVAATSLAWVVGRLVVEDQLHPAVVIHAQPRYREAPDELARVRSHVDLYAGAVVLVRETRPGWLRVELATGESLWVLPEVVRTVARRLPTSPR